jgi:hypothetical protein
VFVAGLAVGGLGLLQGGGHEGVFVFEAGVEDAEVVGVDGDVELGAG